MDWDVYRLPPGDKQKCVECANDATVYVKVKDVESVFCKNHTVELIAEIVKSLGDSSSD